MLTTTEAVHALLFEKKPVEIILVDQIHKNMSGSITTVRLEQVEHQTPMNTLPMTHYGMVNSAQVITSVVMIQECCGLPDNSLHQ